MKTISLKNSENQTIVYTIFEPKIPNGKLLLINSATGVKQQTYWKFAQFFTEQGYVTITYDYYGIGLSKPENLQKCNASMRTWGTRDYKAITNFIKEKYPNFQKFCIGHSVGALILGMNEDSTIFEKFIFVATQKAYVGNLNFGIKMLAYVGFGILQPLFTQIVGYFPAHFFGLGESLPKNAAYDWRILILNKKSTNKLLEKIPDFSHQLHQKTLVISAEDDSWVTQKGMDTLLSETFPNVKPKFRKIAISESEKQEIGHINFFRSFNKNLWEIPLNWIES